MKLLWWKYNFEGTAELLRFGPERAKKIETKNIFFREKEKKNGSGAGGRAELLVL